MSVTIITMITKTKTITLICFQSGGQRVKRSGSSSDQAFSRDESPNRMRHGRGLNRENSRDSMLDERKKSRRDQNDDTGDRDDSPGRSEKTVWVAAWMAACLDGWMGDCMSGSDVWIAEWLNGWMAGRMAACLDGWIGRSVGWLMDRWMDWLLDR